MAGFLGALGEYISTYKLVGEPWATKGWKPWAAMTKKEEEAQRKELLSDHDELMTEGNNVISLCAFRNK